MIILSPFNIITELSERALFVTELHTALASIAGGDKKEYQIQDLCKAFEITGKILILDIEDDTD